MPSLVMPKIMAIANSYSAASTRHQRRRQTIRGETYASRSPRRDVRRIALGYIRHKRGARGRKLTPRSAGTFGGSFTYVRTESPFSASEYAIGGKSPPRDSKRPRPTTSSNTETRRRVHPKVVRRQIGFTARRNRLLGVEPSLYSAVQTPPDVDRELSLATSLNCQERQEPALESFTARNSEPRTNCAKKSAAPSTAAGN